MSQAPPPDDGRDSSPPQKPLASWYAQGLSDGVGDRLLMFDNSNAPSLELLRVRPELASAPGFEEALRERVQRLSRFRHPSFARVRSVENLEPDDGLAVVSNYTPGKRLSELLHQANGPRFARALIRQLAPALALLQEQSAGPGHGALNLDRIVVTPEGRLTIVEYVLGAAIETLGLNSSQLASLGIAVPESDGETSAPLDASTDIYQLGLIALSVLLGRPLGAGEHPQVSRLLSQFAEAAEREGVSFSPLLQHWIERALQVDGERFESLEEAQTALAELLQEDPSREPLRPGIAERSVASASPLPVEPSVASQPEPVAKYAAFRQVHRNHPPDSGSAEEPGAGLRTGTGAGTQEGSQSAVFANAHALRLRAGSHAASRSRRGPLRRTSPGRTHPTGTSETASGRTNPDVRPCCGGARHAVGRRSGCDCRAGVP